MFCHPSLDLTSYYNFDYSEKVSLDLFVSCIELTFRGFELLLCSDLFVLECGENSSKAAGALPVFFIVDYTITSGAIVMFGTRCRIKMFNGLSCFPGFILRPWCNCLASLLPVFFSFFSKVVLLMDVSRWYLPILARFSGFSFSLWLLIVPGCHYG